MSLVTPQRDIDWALDVERSLQDGEKKSYLDCMSGVPMSRRVADRSDSDAARWSIRDGCILTGLFCRCRDEEAALKGGWRG